MSDATPKPPENRTVSAALEKLEVALSDGSMVVVGGGTTAHVEPSEKPGTFASDFTPEDVDRALWEIVMHGGNVAAAHGSLSQWGGSQEPVVAIPSQRTMRNWKNGLYRNRYHEIAAARARDMNEVMAQQHVDLAVKQAEVEAEALRKISERLAGADAVEASIILRNVSGAKKNNVDGAQDLRGTSAGKMGARSVSQLVTALSRLGVVTVSGVDVVDDPEEAELVDG